MDTTADVSVEVTGLSDVSGLSDDAVLAPSARRRAVVPEATVARLPVYLRALHSLAEDGQTTVSSEELAEVAGVNSAKLRKDLSHLGSYGTRGVGYDVEYLVYQVSRELGLTQDWPVVIVGIGNLGAALANYGGFTERGFPVAALVDADRTKVGKSLGPLVIRHIDDLPEIAGDPHDHLAGVVAQMAAGTVKQRDHVPAGGGGAGHGRPDPFW